jgi:hypothetical protein
VIWALEFKPVGPQNQWVDVMFLTACHACDCSKTGVYNETLLSQIQIGT